MVDELTFLEGEWKEAPPKVIVTVERAAYGALALLAAALRFFQLGVRPLSEGEAVQALTAHRFVQGALDVAPAGTLPALFTGNVVGFTLFGANDAAARWLPVVAGVLLTLLPLGLRHRLGRGGALAASLFLAVSPSAVFYSRSLDGSILVAACSLALVVGLIGYLDGRRPVSLYLAAAGLGLGLTSGPAFYTLLLILGLVLLFLIAAKGLHGLEGGWAALTDAWQEAREDEGLLPRAGTVLGATLGLAATTLVLHPAGLGHTADLIGAWVQGFGPNPGGPPLIYPFLLLLRYEPLIVLLGLVEGMAMGFVRRRDPQGERPGEPVSEFPHTTVLALWVLLATLLIAVAGHRPAGHGLLVVVPLALLAGQGVERAVRWLTGRDLWSLGSLVAAVGLGLLIFVYLQVTAYSKASPASTVMVGDIALYTTTTYWVLAAVGLGLMVALGALAWAWRGRDLVLAAGWLIAVVSLGMFGLQAMWGVNVDHAADARELMLLQSTAPEIKAFVAQVEKLSWDQAGDVHTLPITVSADTGPVVAWYLRDWKNLSFVQSLAEPPDTVAAVTLAAQDLPIGETFRGQGYPLRTHWLPWGMWGQDLIRWLLFTEGTLPIVDQKVVLWVASEP